VSTRVGAQDAPRERLDLRREGRGKQQRLTRRGEQREHARELVGEAQVEQAIGLVEHEMLHAVGRIGTPP
jgi:hypothetical protein